MSKKEKIMRKLKIYDPILTKCIDKVPFSLWKKLNSDDLSDYIQRHVLPVVQKESKKLPISKSGYELSPKSNPRILEARA